MLKLLSIVAFIMCIILNANAQSNNVVLIEQFTETGCGACSQYDSAFQATVKANSEKVAVINYHCFYKLDPFYTFNKSCDNRYSFYEIKDGYPTAMVNGTKPGKKTAHMVYVKEPLINSFFEKPAQYKIEINTAPDPKTEAHSTNIKVKATSLNDNPSKNIRLFVAIIENNIIYADRYHSTAPNGIAEFDHILRGLLPDTGGIALGKQTKGKVNQAKVSFTCDDKEINYKEVRIIAFVQDMDSKEVLGTAITKNHPFKD